MYLKCVCTFTACVFKRSSKTRPTRLKTVRKMAPTKSSHILVYSNKSAVPVISLKMLKYMTFKNISALRTFRYFYVKSLYICCTSASTTKHLTQEISWKTRQVYCKVTVIASMKKKYALNQQITTERTFKAVVDSEIKILEISIKI